MPIQWAVRPGIVLQKLYIAQLTTDLETLS